jgi:DNA-binding protein HU-beta
VNKAEFIEKLAEELVVTKSEAAKNFNAVVKCIVHFMKENDELKFSGFGTFKVKKTKDSKMRLLNGEKVYVEAKRKVRFSVGKDFKSAVNGK